MSTPVTITDDNFEAEVLRHDGLVLVDFWAEWCGPCRSVGPVVDEIAQQHEGRLKVGKLDVDSAPITAGKYQVMSIPTLIVFNKGEIANRIVGFSNRGNLLSEVDSTLAAAK